MAHNYSAIKILLSNKGSGLGTIFKKNIINNLLPVERKPTKIFENLIISDNLEIYTIIPRENEKKQSKERHKLQQNKCYFIEQEIFNEKDVDCLIIDMKGEIPYIYGLKISIFKAPIFKKDNLQRSFKILINHLEIKFSIQIDFYNAFFTYAFDYSRIGGQDDNNMIDKCIEEGWKFCFLTEILKFSETKII